MVYMLTKLGYIDGKCDTIYGIHTDPMGSGGTTIVGKLHIFCAIFSMCVLSFERNFAAWFDKVLFESPGCGS